ncbi:MAG TPA: hypothetical protein V6C91_11775, partial [Coleofasciculaceae cyanobacterium]
LLANGHDYDNIRVNDRKNQPPTTAGCDIPAFCSESINNPAQAIGVTTTNGSMRLAKRALSVKVYQPRFLTSR